MRPLPLQPLLSISPYPSMTSLAFKHFLTLSPSFILCHPLSSLGNPLFLALTETGPMVGFGSGLVLYSRGGVLQAFTAYAALRLLCHALS